MKTPSDLKILSTIYDLYYEEFCNYTRIADMPDMPEIQNGREAKIHVPIDCKMIAKKLGVDSDIVFGRLYYHLEQKYGYKRDDDSRVVFFSLGAGRDRHCVNFPLLDSVLAGLQVEDSKFQWATWMSGIALLISIVVPLAGWLTGSPQP